MDLNELRNRIVKSGNVETLNALTCTFENRELELKVELAGVSSVYEFIQEQLDGWKTYGSMLPEAFNDVRSSLEKKLRGIEEFMNGYSQADSSQLPRYWHDLVERLTIRSPFMLYNSPSTMFLLEVHKSIPDAFEGAHAYINNIIDHNSIEHTRAYMTGMMMAYEFVMKDGSALIESRLAEKESIESSRRDYNSFITQAETQLIQTLRSAKDSYEDYVLKLDKSKVEREKAFDNWFTDATAHSENFNEKSSTRIAELEKTYAELLRLKKPAEYWRDRAKTLKSEGRIAFGIAMGLVVIMVVLLFCLLRNPPKEMQESFSSGNTSALKWSIVFVVFVSFMAVLLRVVTKFMYSSFHLSRDAEEREQLVYVYLALRNDAAVDDKDKNIILQSLFSRAESGLLKEESGPTMPTQAIIDKFTK